MNYSYDTIAELVKASRKECSNASNVELLAYDSGAGFICADRRNITTYKAANEALSSPLFPQGAERVERLSKEIAAPTPQSIKRRMTRGVEGDELDMGRVWQGDLDQAWTRAKRQHTVSASRVLISVYMSANFNVSSESIAWRGVAALALADALEAAGYSVAVQGVVHCDLTDGQRTPYSLEVVAKHESEPLDLHKAASLLASTLLFRGVIFQHMISHAARKITRGLASDRPDRFKAVAANFDHVAMVTPSVHDARTAQAWVTAQVAILDARNAA